MLNKPPISVVTEFIPAKSAAAVSLNFLKSSNFISICFCLSYNRNPRKVSTKPANSVPIKVELAYGKAILEAKCNNCGQVQRKELDWGWND